MWKNTIVIMKEYVFKKNRNLQNKFKSFYSHLWTDIAPAVFGVILLHVAYSEYFEFSEPNVAICYLIAGVVVALYALFRIWKLYKAYSAPRITSFILDEKGVCINFNKYPYKASAHWRNIERIEYFPGEEKLGLTYKVEYLEYTDFYGLFKDYRGAEFNQVVRIMNNDWGNEQDESLSLVLQRFEGSIEKLRVIECN